MLCLRAYARAGIEPTTLWLWVKSTNQYTTMLPLIIHHLTYWRQVQSVYTRAGIYGYMELFVTESHHLQWANINKRKGDSFEEGLEIWPCNERPMKVKEFSIFADGWFRINRPYAYDVTEGRPAALGVKRNTATCVIAKHAARGANPASHTAGLAHPGPRTERLSANAHCQHNTCALRDTRLASLLWRCDPLWRQCIRSIDYGNHVKIKTVGETPQNY